MMHEEEGGPQAQFYQTNLSLHCCWWVLASSQVFALLISLAQKPGSERGVSAPVNCARAVTRLLICLC